MGPTIDPQGSDEIARWARAQRTSHFVRPEQSWFRNWEPYDTMISPSCYLNACSWPLRSALFTLAEPWTEEGDEEPMERAVLAFVTHPRLRWRAAARAGEHFLTRVAFLESPPPPEVKLGDPQWDEHVMTRAFSADEAARALRPALRQLLAGWGFLGHLELRPGGLVVHYAGYWPSAESYAKLSNVAAQILAAALR
jgi:hypothetical protein